MDWQQRKTGVSGAGVSEDERGWYAKRWRVWDTGGGVASLVSGLRVKCAPRVGW
jgi:hypothetical protein